jgi:hypothetical protein
MTDTTPSSREFNVDTGCVKEVAHFIADRSRPAQVLLTMQEHQRLAGGSLVLRENV